VGESMGTGALASRVDDARFEAVIERVHRTGMWGRCRSTNPDELIVFAGEDRLELFDRDDVRQFAEAKQWKVGLDILRTIANEPRGVGKLPIVVQIELDVCVVFVEVTIAGMRYGGRS
jgi:hypothetical protein